MLQHIGITLHVVDGSTGTTAFAVVLQHTLPLMSAVLIVLTTLSTSCAPPRALITHQPPPGHMEMKRVERNRTFWMSGLIVAEADTVRLRLARACRTARQLDMVIPRRAIRRGSREE